MLLAGSTSKSNSKSSKKKNGNEDATGSETSDTEIDETSLTYHADGRVICPKCGEPVNIGTVGLSNLIKRHIPSEKCKRQRTAKIKAAKPKALQLFAFFKRGRDARIVSSTALSPTVINTSPIMALAHTLPAASALHQMMTTLPPLIPGAESTTFLAEFEQSAATYDDKSLTPEELWEEILNSFLHRAFGWGDEIQRERLLGLRVSRIGALLKFVNYFVERGIDGHLFEPRLARLVFVLEEWNSQNTAISPIPPDKIPAIVVNDDSDSDPIPSVPSLEKPKSVRKGMTRCTGYTQQLPPGLSPHTAYPFALHDILGIPWDYSVQNGVLTLTSKQCTRHITTTHPNARTSCQYCHNLPKNDILQGIISRIEHGVKESTSHAYHGIGGLIQLLRHKDQQINHYRLRGLNQARKIVATASSLAVHKRFLMAVASHKIERVDRIIKIGLRQKQGIRTLLSQCIKAATNLYKPKSYEEEDYMRGLVLWKLGGDRIASISHRALGLPSITTLRNQIRIAPILPSPGRPLVDHVAQNVEMTFEALLDALKLSAGAQYRHAVLMFDEIATEKRIRWDPKTNKFLGVCREHASKVALDFGQEGDMVELFRSIDDGVIHYAGEATIGALGILSDDNRIYTARGILISGDCKQESGIEHATIITTVLEGVNTHRNTTNIRVISIASDGEARRGAALIELTFKQMLSPQSDIYDHLSTLIFMDFHVGDDDITPDKDWKHIFKRLRNLFLRERGVVILGFRITPSIIKAQLEAAGVSLDHIRAILNPEDKQDVKLAFDLLKAIWTLPRTTTNTKPGFSEAREALWTLGQLLFHISYPYLCVDLSLSEQLEQLAAAAHLLLYLYTEEKHKFIPTLLFTDIMLMIKNVFFCVAKTKVDDPNGSFWVILLGTDRLEEIFGALRTIIGTDSNVDILQLSWRLAGIAEIANILARFPHWDRPPRRLKLPTLTREGGTISSDTADHLKPRYWRGCLKVLSVSLLTCWKTGRRTVQQAFPKAADSFSALEKAGATILSPHNKLLVNIPLTDDDIDESFDDPSEPSTDSAETDTAPNDLSGVEAETRVEVEDTIGDEFQDDEDNPSTIGPIGINLQTHVTPSCVPSISFDKKITIDNVTSLKSRALARYSKYRKVSTSTDRLKRVRHEERYTTSTTSTPTTFLTDPDNPDPLDTDVLNIHDPIATLLCCENQIWMCIGETNGLRVDGIAVDEVSRASLSDDRVIVSFQVLGLRPTRINEDPSSRYDWRTYRMMNELSYTIPGRCLEPIDPQVASLPEEAVRVFYLLDSRFLIALAADLLSRFTLAELRSVPKTAASGEFPYHEAAGKCCFLCEDEREFKDIGYTGSIQCEFCDPPVFLDTSQGQRLIEHSAAHILHDPKVRAVDEPCGFCLQPAPICRTYLKKGKGANASLTVDSKRSNCKIKLKFSYAIASTSSASSPCTNVPIICPHCPKSSPAVWKYNIKAHIRTRHPSKSLVDAENTCLWGLLNFEKVSMQKIWVGRHKHTVSRPRKNGKGPELVISHSHRSQNVTIPLSPDTLDPANVTNDHIPADISESLESDVSHSILELPSFPQYITEDPLDAASPTAKDTASSCGMGIEDSGIGGRRAETFQNPHNSTSHRVASAPITVSMLPLSTTAIIDCDTAASAATLSPDTTKIAAGIDTGIQLPSLGTGGRPQRSRKKRTIEDMEGGLDALSYCVCGSKVDHAGGIPLICCRKRGCETVWYHIACIGLEIVPKSWVCDSCEKSGGKKSKR